MNYDILFLRRPALNYVSPPICEVIFSGTGGPVIFTGDIFIRESVLNVAFGPADGGFPTITWSPVPDALCYTIYYSESESGSFTILEECIPADGCSPEPCFVLPKSGCYRISAITPEGETELSDPICTTTTPSLFVETDSATDVTTPGGSCTNIFENIVWGVPSITDTDFGGTSGAFVENEGFDLEVDASVQTGGSRRVDVIGTFSYAGPSVISNLHIQVFDPVQASISRIIVSHSVDGELLNERFDSSAGVFDQPFTVPASAGEETITVSLSIFADGSEGNPGHNHWFGYFTSCP